jgi:hypothetical protein
MKENQLSEVKSSANLKVGDAVKVTVSSGVYDWSTAKTTRPAVTAKGKITKIVTQEKSVHAGDIGPMYTVKFKNPLSGRIETSEFDYVMPESVQAATLQTARQKRIVELATNSPYDDLIASFVESTDDFESLSVLDIKEKYHAFIEANTPDSYEEGGIVEGECFKIRCVESYGGCRVGNTYNGRWVADQTSNLLRLQVEDLPGATQHPIAFYNKTTNYISIPKQFALL